MTMSINYPISRVLLSKPLRRCYVCRLQPSLRSLSTEARRRPLAYEIKTSRIPSKYIWYLLSFGIGAGSGLALHSFAVSRLEPPKPDSQEDAIALHALADQMNQLDIVKTMRAQSYHLHSDSPLGKPGKERGGWIELDMTETMGKISVAKDGNTRTLTHQALAGVQGLGLQRVFWNTETRELVAVVWIGPRLSGWPGIAHGGAIATIFEDAMSRMIAGPNIPIDSIPTPTSMSVTYDRPTPSFNIYVLRASFSKPDLYQVEPPPQAESAKSWLPYWKDFTKKWTSTLPEPAMEISGTLESLEGEVKVRVKGTWPASAVIEGKA